MSRRVWHLLGRRSSVPFLESDNGSGRKPVWLWAVLLASASGTLSFIPELSHAREMVPGEDTSGFFYAITHLHPLAYLVLFLVFILSLVNLAYQLGILGRRSISSAHVGSDFSEMRPQSNELSGVKPPFDGIDADSFDLDQPGEESLTEAAGDVSTPLPAGDAHEHADADSLTPTPVEGVNHPLPAFSSTEPSQEPQDERKSGPDSQTAYEPEFKFSSAVDIPSPEERERRSKEKLVVSGSIKDSNGKPIGDALVYLTDRDGQRVGQTCRSREDTGEFTVMVNEPGAYFLNAHKRGIVMKDCEPVNMPLKAGKVEGIAVEMIPKGASVHGRVVPVNPEDSVTDLRVRCISTADGTYRYACLNITGQFEISGLLDKASYYLEVRDSDGAVVAGTAEFRTNVDKDLYRKIDLAAPPESSGATSDDPSEVWEKDGNNHSGTTTNPPPVAH